MSRTTRALALVVLIAAVAGATEPNDQRPEDARHRSATPLRNTTPSPLAAPAASRATNAQVRAQDRLSVRQREHEAAALQRRRLLDHLPLQLAGVRVEVAGISADGRRTALLVDAGPHDRRFARTAYREALHTYDDSGRAYELRWKR